MDKVEGIVVSEIDYRDTSKIINVLSPNGLIGMIAKGCKSPKSVLRSCTDKLTYGNFYIKYKENKLSTLNNFDNFSLLHFGQPSPFKCLCGVCKKES